MAIPTGTLPWTKSCFVCGEENPHGLRLKSGADDGRVILEYTARERDLGWRSIVHGGIIMTLLDEVMTWAAILAAGRPCIAAETTIRLKAPIRAGDALRVQGEIPERASRIVKTGATVTLDDGTVAAVVSGKYVLMAPDEVVSSDEDFVWSPDAIDLPWLREEVEEKK